MTADKNRESLLQMFSTEVAAHRIHLLYILLLTPMRIPIRTW